MTVRGKIVLETLLFGLGKTFPIVLGKNAAEAAIMRGNC
jgi:hypothetical protein